MPDRILLPLVVACLALSGGAALAQSCSQLTSELALVDRGGPDRRYEKAFRDQSAALRRTEDRARRAGCFGGNFLFFRGRPSPECRTLIPDIRKMQANLARFDALRRRGGDPRRAAQLRARMASLGCGREGGETLSRPENGYVNRGTYRTLCVRSCDGYYFPVSFATTRSQFPDDASQCQRSCGSSAELFYHPNPGSGPEDMISLTGRPYGSLPMAFQYRQSYNPSCTCEPAEARYTTIGTQMPRQVPAGIPVAAAPRLPVARPAFGEDPETVAGRLGGFVPMDEDAPKQLVEAPRGFDGVRVVGDVYWAEQPSDALLLTRLPD